MRIARVIPLKKMPRGIDFFDYLVPEELDDQVQVGDFVEIPFRNRWISGLIYSFAAQTELADVKTIRALDRSYLTLRNEQIKLLEWLAHYYYYSLPSTLSLFVPERPKTKRNVKEFLFPPVVSVDGNGRSIVAFAKKIWAAPVKKYLLLPPSVNWATVFYLELCARSLAEGKQILILFPQRLRLEEFLRYWPLKFRTRTLISTKGTRLTKNEEFNAWRAVQDGSKMIIIGTRSAIFLPFSKLGTIVIDGAHSEDYKQWDQNPRYETINVAKKIQALSNARLILSSVAPRLEDWFSAKPEHFSLIKAQTGSSINIKIIDLGQEPKSDFVYLSDHLLENLQRGERQGEKALLIVNRRGEYSYFGCRDCGWSAICPECCLPFIVSQEQLLCHRCQKQQVLPLICPQCQGVNLKKIGLGIERVMAELKKRFIGVLADLSMRNSDWKNARIFLSTGQNVPQSILAQVSFLAFVYVDALVYLADFNSSFRLYGSIRELIYRASASTKNLTIILQTYFPQPPAFSEQNNDYQAFFQRELTLRQTYGYPPFSTLIKLFFEHHDRGVAEKEAWRLYRGLAQKLTTAGAKITEPYLYYAQKVRKKYRYQIAVFLPLDQEGLISDVLRKLPDYWRIDKNPISLL